jgi:hypothetical protein
VRLPSVQLLAAGALAAARRFPFVLFAALAAGTSGMLLVGGDEAWVRWLLSAGLGLPLLLALALAAERWGWNRARGTLLGLGGLLVLLAFALLWPRWSDAVAVTRAVQLAVGFHLLVAFLPFVGHDEPNGFWQHNKTLLLRFLTAAVFSAVLFVGLAVATAALDQLFGVDVDPDTYGRLWFAIVFIFNTWFFLGGVPEDLAALEGSDEYPRGLKVFAQYVLVPLVTVYLAILMAYLVKVVATQDWPSGWIGYLVSSVAAAGILALLLVHPVRERAENRWVATYARWFYIVLLPAIVMLWMAIWQRVDQYGITEPRYFLTILSIWLAGIAVHSTLRGSRKIVLIPTTLCALALATFFGPWSAYAVSRRSQTARLEGVLVRNEMLVDGAVRPAAGDLSFEDRREISAALRYLVATHGTGTIEPWFDGSLAAIDTVGAGTAPSRGGQTEQRVRLITAYLGVPYASPWQQGGGVRFAYYPQFQDLAVPVRGYDFGGRVDGPPRDARRLTGDLALHYDSVEVALALARGEDDLVTVPLLAVVERAIRYSDAGQSDPVSRDSMFAAADNERAGMAVYVGALSGERREDGLSLTTLRADVYVVVR